MLVNPSKKLSLIIFFSCFVENNHYLTAHNHAIIIAYEKLFKICHANHLLLSEYDYKAITTYCCTGLLIANSKIYEYIGLLEKNLFCQ